MYRTANLAKMLGIPILLGMILMLSNCSKNGELSTQKLLKSGEADLLTIHFDLEHYISSVPIHEEDAAALHKFDKIKAVPQFKRDKGTLSVKSDSSVVVTLELVDATNQVVIPHEVPTDPNRVKPAYIIIENDVAKTYDANNTLLYEEPCDMTMFKNMVELIGEGKYGTAPTLDETFTKTEENDNYQAYEFITENGTNIMVKDKVNNRLAFTELKDVEDNTTARQIFQYHEESNGEYPNIKRTVQFMYSKSVEGTIDMVTTITTDFKTFIVTDNI